MCASLGALLIALLLCATNAARTPEITQFSQLAPLPLPAIDIPSDLKPPLAQGRVDYHGWLWLPIVTPTPDDKLISGWFYHHTPEFNYPSPHNFEIMVFGSLALDDAVPNLPFPPSTPLVGTEYVFTPPAFSLDELITSTVTRYYGAFRNGSFDTPTKTFLSNATFTVEDLITVKYLREITPEGYPLLPYYSYPRQLWQKTSDPSEVQHLYFLHLLEHQIPDQPNEPGTGSPDFDQIVHITIDPTTCTWYPGDTIKDLTFPGATFVFPSIENNVTKRLGPSDETLVVNLYTERSKYDDFHTMCNLVVLEEIHCVIVPDSFSNCPPRTL